MKRALPIILAISATTANLVTSVTANPINGSFESGAFEGWRLENPRGYSSSQPRNPFAGTAAVIANWGQSFGLNQQRSAPDGSKFAALGTLANGNFIGNRTYNISLNQELTLAVGETISGWSFFFNGDYQTQDAAWVKVLDLDGQIIATPWLENSGCDLNSAPYQEATPWSQWFWQVPEDGTYTVSLGVTTRGDDNCASYGFFDDIFKTPANLPVPEPSALSIVAIGATLLAASRRRRN